MAFSLAVICAFYIQRIKENSRFEAIKVLTLSKKQYECIKSNDSKCIVESNKILIGVVAANLERLYEHELDKSEHKTIREFILFERQLNK
jgi:hypothetical protein